MTHPNRRFFDLKPVVCIGGSDSSSGAGIQVDMRALAALGIPYKNIITSVTSQEDGTFYHQEEISSKSLKAQAQAVLKEESIVKIGMLGSSLKILDEILKNRKDTIILDPVLFSSSGAPLFRADDLKLLKQFLAKVMLITPNILEAETLWGKSIETTSDVEKAAKYIRTLGVKNVLIKGGHLNFCGDYFLGEQSFWIKKQKINKSNVRGTGCFLASSIAGGLSLGLNILDSLVMAQIFLHKSFRNAYKQGDFYYLNPEPFHQNLKPEDMPWIQDSFEDAISFSEFALKNKTTLYPIVDRAHWIKDLAGARPSLIQLRIKDLAGVQLELEIKEAIRLSKELGISLFINDFWQLAIKYGAFGVHLGQEDLADADINLLREKGIRLGISTHCYFEAARAQAIRPSYIAFGPIFHTALKAMDFAPQGLENLKLWRDLFELPLVAIGGINLDRGTAVAKTGVDIISVVRDILLNPTPLGQAQAWKSKIGEQIH